MTSNAGFHEINVGFNNEFRTSRLNESFSVPFMNRVDKVIKFNDLNENDVKKIIKLELKNFKNKYKDKIKIKISNEIIDEIISLIDYKIYGARKIKKVIKDKVENIVIDGIIEDKKEIIINSLKQGV